MPKLKVSVAVGKYINYEDVLDIDPDEWCRCITDTERQMLIDDYWWKWAITKITREAEVIEEEVEENGVVWSWKDVNHMYGGCV